MQECGRDLRVADLLRKEIARIVQRRMRDPRIGGFSVNDVRVSRDLSVADVYVSSLGARGAEEQEALVALLNRAAGFFRSECAKGQRMRRVPKPRFHYDPSIERGPRLERLIDRALAADRRDGAHG